MGIFDATRFEEEDRVYLYLNLVVFTPAQQQPRI